MTKSDQNASLNEEAEKIPVSVFLSLHYHLRLIMTPLFTTLLELYSPVQVAIKLLRVLSSKGYDEVKARKRLNREVYVWHRLDHPNIATFLGTSYHMGNRPSLVLPWFKNGSASEYLRLKNPGADRLRLVSWRLEAFRFRSDKDMFHPLRSSTLPKDWSISTHASLLPSFMGI